MELSWGKCIIFAATLDHVQALYKMEALKDFPEEFAKSFHPSFVFLKYFNIRYLQEEQSFLKKYWRFFYIVPVVLIHILGLCVHMVLLLKYKDMTQVAYLLPPLLVCLHATLKALIVIPKTGQISSFINNLGSLWRTKFIESQSKEKDALLWRLNFNNKVVFWVTVCGSALYLMSSFLETLIRRFILHEDCELLLPIAATYPFNHTNNWVIYILVYIFQLCAMMFLVSIYIGSEFIMITSCGLLATAFLMLQNNLAKGNSRRNSDRNHKEDLTIKDFVERHQKLIGLSGQLDNVFNRLVFIDLLFTGITTCAFSFAADFARSRIYTLINYVAVANSLLNILYMCYYGELLTGASARIGDLAYKNLYDGDKENKVAIWLIIKISQSRPCCLTSLRYAVVSLNMFTKVISTTWSYFSLMNSVYSEE